ncbi:alpha/beta fold hydrolase [Egicoccus sp. AB-alg2]|uniref:alpha/beta fold hydrolase n=1 Tax=Egicoccus sp. AB-alg2 TaxID=3242693 RepID=UPI00359DECA3
MTKHETRWNGDRGGHAWPKDREAVTPDDVRIRYTVLGEEHRRARPLVLCAGYLCPDNHWAPVAEALAERQRVVVLNYRGVGASTCPAGRPSGLRAARPEDYTIERLADDVTAVIEAEGLRDVVLLGHSMGCEVALAVWRARTDLVGGLVLVTGPFSSPMQTFYGSRIGAHLFPLLYHGLPLVPGPLRRAAARAPRLPLAMPVARAIRALGPYTPAEGMDAYFRHLGACDPAVALEVARGMHEFDAGPWLHEVDVPTQILVGSADPWSPPSVGEQMLASMPDAELSVVADATHGALLEFPDEIADAIADFLHRRLGATPAVRRGAPGRVSPPRRREDGEAGAA